MTLPVVTLDFETFYSKEYSLRKLTTEEYIRDPRFWVHMVGWKYNNAQTQVVLNPNQETLKVATNNGRCILVGHNLMFDAAILKWRYGIQCKFMYDTMCMAQPLFGQTIGASLSAVAKALLLGEKGTELHLLQGKYIRDLDTADTAKVIAYNATDVELTRKVFDVLQPQTPKPEAYLIDLLLRMYIDPVLQLDRELLERHLNDVVARREEILAQFDGDFITKLRSNQQFAALLQEYGVEPPMKISRTTGKPTFAFAKNDPEFLALKTHDDLRISTLVHARLGVKSSIEETRTAAFIGIAKRGPLPMPYKYWGAHTGRLSGQEKINPQNLGRTSPLRASIMAPPGHVVVVADSAQIEARKVAWLAGQQDLVQDFASAVDIYSKFASTVYAKPINKKEHPTERFVGKTCIAEGQLVLTDAGLVPIEDVTLEHRLWDGQEWVSHEGVINQGLKQVITWDGLTATEDHQVFTEDGRILPLGEAASQMVRLVRTGAGRQAVRFVDRHVVADTARKRLSVGESTLQADWNPALGQHGQPKSGQDHIVFSKRTEACTQRKDTWTTLRRDQIPVQQPTRPSVQTLRREGGKASVYVADALHQMGVVTSATRNIPVSRDRSNRQQRALRTGQLEASIPHGTSPQQTNNSARAMEGASSTPGAVSFPVPVFMDAQVSKARPDGRTNYRTVQVFDIANAGPRRRFTVSNCLVLNCILGLGYGMGSDKFQYTLKVGQTPVEITTQEAVRIVRLYRDTYPAIAKLWRSCEVALNEMLRGKECHVGVGLELRCTPEGVHLPNGTMIRYPNLRRTDKGDIVYDSRYGEVYLYGAKMVENIVQALARIVVMHQMMRFDREMRRLDRPEQGRRFKVALTTHDEIGAVVPEDCAEWARDTLQQIMSEPPAWARGLPVACEVGFGQRYSDAK